jgi:hypothetical protein
VIYVLLHIVRSGENINKIADNYQCEVSDITSNNLHITDFSHLQPGMKLRIPFLTKETIEVLEETESFIKDYYPNLNKDFKTETKEVKDDISEPDENSLKPILEETKEVEIKEENIVSPASELPKEIIKNESLVKNPCIKNVYRGNVIPNIPPQYIKKI